MIAAAGGAFADPAIPPPSQAVDKEFAHPWAFILR